MNAARRVAAAASALCVAACAVGPNYERPALPAPASFRDVDAEAASFADTPWFEVFRDDALGELVREALAGNRDLAVAAARVEQARYFAAVSRSELFPQLGYEADAARGDQTFLGGISPGTDTGESYLAALDLAWELDVWGRIRRSSEAARAELMATEAFRRGIVLSLVAGVSRAYFELRELDLELEIARRSVENFQETYDLFNRQFTGGVVSRLDPLRAEAALAQAAATVPDIERRIVAKENELSVLLGRPAGGIPRGTALTAQSLPPEIPVGVPSHLLERRPDLIESEEVLVASNARVGVQLADYFPRIGLTALAGSVSPELSELLSGGNSAWSVAGSVLGPLFTAGRTTYEWQAALADRDAATASYEGAVLNALREVSDALTAREKLALQRAEQEREVGALTDSLRIARSRYMGGLASYFEVLDAQQQLFPAELALAQTRRDQLLAVVELYRALGGGWTDAAQEPEVPLPIVP